MKRIASIFLFLFAIVLSCDPQFCPRYFHQATSVATADDAFSLLLNPAGLSVGNATGFSYMTPFDTNSFKRSYALSLYGEGLGYAYERTEGATYHRLAVSENLGPDYHLGVNWDWNKGAFHDGHYGVSALFRPANTLSLGTNNQFYDHSDYNSYQIGIGLRPVPWNGGVWDRLTLTADLMNDYKYDPYLSDSHSARGWRKPTIGMETELLDGVRLAGQYRFESKTVGLNFSLCFGSTRSGVVASYNRDHVADHGLWYLHLDAQQFRSQHLFRPRNEWYSMTFKPAIVDRPAVTKFGPIAIVNPNQEALYDILQEIEQVKNDSDVKGIYFKSPQFKASFAHVTEIHDALLRCKQAGKKIIFYFDDATNLNYALAASVADEIYLNPMGSIDLRGISVTNPYLKDLLDTLGIQVDNFRSHPFKTAGNMFSESSMPDSERVALDYVLGGMYAVYKDMIASGRGDRLHQPIDEIIDNGPYTIADDALAAGLVDGLYYEDEITDLLKRDHVKPILMEAIDSQQQTTNWSLDPGPDVALIYASGNIHMGTSNPGSSIGSETFAEAIKDARENPSVKGIILRVDSGGGSALASDIIAREIRKCKTGPDAKPVYVSMGGMAGSGGYYISTFADRIYAEPATITGSIGVIGITFNLERLFDRVHVHFSSVKKGAQSDMGTLTRDMTPAEKALMKRSIEHTYDAFVKNVAEGRKMPFDDVNAIAQGRIWTGEQAKARGLVDEIGGLTETIAGMKKTLHVDRVHLVVFPQSSGFTVNADLSWRGSTVLLPAAIEPYEQFYRDWSAFQNDRILYLMPYFWDLSMD